MGRRPFRFGITMISLTGDTEWADKCRLAEQLGYDVILVPDHPGAPAPFPALVRAADVTERPRLGTFVLNAGFWNPTLLAREVATVDMLVGTVAQIADQLRAARERFGISYVTVLEELSGS